MPSRDSSVRHGRKDKLPSPAAHPGILSAAQRFWQRSYAGDYAGLAVLVLLYIPLKLFGEPFHKMFRLDDPRIQHPHAEVERVGVCTSTPLPSSRQPEAQLTPSPDMLLLYTLLPPLALFLTTTLIPPSNRHKTHPLLLGFASTLILTTFLTDILKDAIGRPRPDLLARCAPRPSTSPTALVTIAVCTETQHHRLHDGWRSFPSGHSSLAFASFTWTALFLASQTHLFRPRAGLATALLCLAPLVGAAMIAISRLEDYRHDVEDVAAGSALGVAVAYANWRRFWPALGSRECDEPYAVVAGAGRGSPGGGFRRVRDEEEGVVDGRERFSIGDDGGGYGREV